MYCSERPDGYEDFASVALKNGFLEFRFDTGSGKDKKMFFICRKILEIILFSLGVLILKSNVTLSVGQWHKIQIERRMKEGRLKIDDHPKISGKSLGRSRGLNIHSPIFFGGINRKYKISLLQDTFLFCFIFMKIFFYNCLSK